MEVLILLAFQVGFLVAQIVTNDSSWYTCNIVCMAGILITHSIGSK